MDDPGEGGPTLNPTTGVGKLKWNWATCCNDGAVIGPLAAPFCVTSTFSNLSGITGLGTVDHTGSTVVLGPASNPLVLCANP